MDRLTVRAACDKFIRNAFKKNRKIRGFCPKRREGVISETQFLHTFKLGLLSEEGGGQNLNSQICMQILLTKHLKRCPFLTLS